MKREKKETGIALQLAECRPNELVYLFARVGKNGESSEILDSLALPASSGIQGVEGAAFQLAKGTAAWLASIAPFCPEDLTPFQVSILDNTGGVSEKYRAIEEKRNKSGKSNMPDDVTLELWRDGCPVPLPEIPVYSLPSDSRGYPASLNLRAEGLRRIAAVEIMSGLADSAKVSSPLGPDPLHFDRWTLRYRPSKDLRCVDPATKIVRPWLDVPFAGDNRSKDSGNTWKIELFGRDGIGRTQDSSSPFSDIRAAFDKTGGDKIGDGGKLERGQVTVTVGALIHDPSQSQIEGCYSVGGVGKLYPGGRWEPTLTASGALRCRRDLYLARAADLGSEQARRPGSGPVMARTGKKTANLGNKMRARESHSVQASTSGPSRLISNWAGK